MKILIIGNSGSGKSTLAEKIADQYKIPVYHLDQYFWKPNWKESTLEEFLCKQQNLMNAPNWILEGMSTHGLEDRVKRSDIIIYLKTSRAKCYYQLFKRFVLHLCGQKRIGLPKDCKNKIDFDLLKHIWSFKKEREWHIVTILDKYKTSKKILVIKNHKDLKFPFDL